MTTTTTSMTTTTTSQRRWMVLCVVLGALLVLVAALAAWLGRDEFHQLREEAQASDAAEPAAAEGPPRVSLSAAAQRNLGLKTAAPMEASRATGGALVELLVVDPQALAEARGKLRGAAQELDAARAQAEASARELRRVQGLFDDDRSASQRALDAARAQAAADAAHQGAQQAALDSLQAAARATWGPTVAGWLGAAQAAALDPVFNGRATLLRAQATAGVAPPPGRLQLDGGADARPLDAAAATAQRLYLAPAARVAPGQRLWARAAGHGAAVDGAWVPASAVVWHAGQPWVYVQQAADDDDAPPAAAAAASAPAARDSFRRRALASAERVDERWFVPGLEDEDKVVVQGAQVLLSEELKFQLRNENDD